MKQPRDTRREKRTAMTPRPLTSKDGSFLPKPVAKRQIAKLLGDRAGAPEKDHGSRYTAVPVRKAEERGMGGMKRVDETALPPPPPPLEWASYGG